MAIDINGLLIDNKSTFTESEIQEIKQLLLSCPNNSISVEHIWHMMDHVWDQLGCDNQNLNEKKLSAFYSHPVWILNGLFIEQDAISIQHRQSIANWININSEKIKYVVDYGGGMGTLARAIADKNSNFYIDIYEPYPSQVAIDKLDGYPTVKFVDRLENETYDCLVSTDVLEHVKDPLNLLAEMIDSVKLGGYLIVAHCFQPTIKCHLPTTFHLRFTFQLFTKLMGLKFIEACPKSHATVYLKDKKQPVNWQQIRQVETLSKFAFPMLKSLHQGYRVLNPQKI